MDTTLTEKEDIMSKVIIAVDLGHFKAYRVTKDPFAKSAKAELIESYDSIEARLKLSDRLSDAAGRYRPAAGTAKLRDLARPITSKLKRKRGW